MISQQTFQELYNKLLSGQIRRDEYDQFLEFVAAEHNQDLVEQVMNARFAAKNHVPDESEIVVEQQVASNRMNIWRKWAKIAAILVLVSTIGWGSWKSLSPLGDEAFERTTSGRPSETLLLPDGSVVKLNSFTKLRYAINEDGERIVQLSGEAYFDVKHSSDNQPFIIETGTSTLRVLGTAFNVNSRGERDEVYLDRGSIELGGADEDKLKVVLTPGETGIVSKKETEIAVSHSKNFRDEAAWREGLLRLSDVKLSEIIVRLNEVYHKNIRVSKPELLKTKMELTLPYSNWEVTKHALALALGIEITDLAEGDM